MINITGDLTGTTVPELAKYEHRIEPDNYRFQLEVQEEEFLKDLEPINPCELIIHESKEADYFLIIRRLNYLGILQDFTAGSSTYTNIIRSGDELTITGVLLFDYDFNSSSRHWKRKIEQESFLKTLEDIIKRKSKFQVESVIDSELNPDDRALFISRSFRIEPNKPFQSYFQEYCRDLEDCSTKAHKTLTRSILKDTRTPLDNIKGLIAEDKAEEAIEELRHFVASAISLSNEDNTLRLIEGNLESLKKDFMKGIISVGDMRVSKNRIKDNLLQYIDLLQYQTNS